MKTSAKYESSRSNLNTIRLHHKHVIHHARICSLISTAAVHKVLLHWAAALCTDHLFWDVSIDPRKDEAVAMFWSVKFLEVLIQCGHETILLNVVAPIAVLCKAF